MPFNINGIIMPETIEEVRATLIKLGILGPWIEELDYLSWGLINGYVCTIKRSTATFCYCGYVSIPPDHPMHGVGYDGAIYGIKVHGGIRVHGGITFAGLSIDSGYWTFGFDCSHLGDVAPAMISYQSNPYKHAVSFEEKYRDLAYVIKEVDSLAQQLSLESLKCLK